MGRKFDEKKKAWKPWLFRSFYAEVSIVYARIRFHKFADLVMHLDVLLVSVSLLVLLSSFLLSPRVAPCLTNPCAIEMNPKLDVVIFMTALAISIVSIGFALLVAFSPSYLLIYGYRTKCLSFLTIIMSAMLILTATSPVRPRATVLDYQHTSAGDYTMSVTACDDGMCATATRAGSGGLDSFWSLTGADSVVLSAYKLSSILWRLADVKTLATITAGTSADYSLRTSAYFLTRPERRVDDTLRHSSTIAKGDTLTGTLPSQLSGLYLVAFEPAATYLGQDWLTYPDVTLVEKERGAFVDGRLWTVCDWDGSGCV